MYSEKTKEIYKKYCHNKSIKVGKNMIDHIAIHDVMNAIEFALSEANGVETSDDKCTLHGVIESIPIHDIRNKLSPVCNLIAMIGKPECEKYIDKEIKNCKKSINYLADREVYSL